MKKTKILTIAVLICLIFFGLFSVALADDDDKQKEFETAVAQAEDYMERGLYQLAIMEYEKAVAIEDSEALRDSVLTAYEKRYEESATILDSYISAAQSAVSSYSQKADYYIILANAYMRNDDYQAAYKALVEAKNNGIADDEVLDLYTDVKYAFETKWYTYTDFLPCTDGIYPVMNSELWGYIDETGDTETGLNYSFVSQSGDEGIRILAGDQVVFMDEGDVVRGKLSFVPTQSGVFSEGLIAIHNGESFGYYNSLGDFQFGEYLAASNFKNGKAAVAINEDFWVLIDATGKTVSDKSYQEIRLNPDGSYLLDDMMLAKTEGKYKLYDQDGNPIGNFECDNVDVMTNDGLIAYESNGKWGFVNTSGEIVITPQFDQAKSFSNGLAAVCVEEQWGFIDESGEIVIECQFLNADYFNTEKNCFVKTTPGYWQMISLKVNF